MTRLELSAETRPPCSASEFSDIAAMLSAQATLAGASPAISNAAGLELNYLELRDKSFAIAGVLQGDVARSARRRARFGIVMPNGMDIAVVLLGASIAGEAAPINPHSTAAELASYYDALKLDGLIVREDEQGPAIAVATEMGLRIYRVNHEYKLNQTGAIGISSLPKPNDVALVLMTSGSTGRPKIVPLSHRNVCRSAFEVATSLELSAKDRCLLMWEQFHIGGLVDLLLAPLTSRGSIIATSGFDASLFFDLLDGRQPTWYQAVPTTLGELVRTAEKKGLARVPSSLRFIRCVAAALSPQTMERASSTFEVPIVRTFGMTEAGPLITSTPLKPVAEKPRSVGKPIGTKICIFGPNGAPLEIGVEGEVGIKGSNVFSGYEGNPEANSTSFRDGWFLTGDIGYVDAEGDLVLTGRIKQMINRGGEKISPQEVDDALQSHPSVMEAACFAIAHPTLGEDIAAAVVLRSEVAPLELRRFLSERLSSFKVPQQIAMLDALPRNPVGKIDRLQLAQRSHEWLQSRATDNDPPRNPTEALLAEIWKRELYLDAVGVNQDFAALGGDSLSRMRVFLGAEAAFQQSLPPEPFTEGSTIAEIARALESAGYSLRITEGEAAKTADTSLSAVGVGTIGYEDDLPKLIGKLETCRSSVHLAAILDGMELYTAPDELRAMLAAIRKIKPGKRAKVSIFSRLRMFAALKVASWKTRVRLSSSSTRQSWTRQPTIGSGVYYSSNGSPRENTLLVGFTGNLGRLMLPTWRVLNSLPVHVDLLLLNDPSRRLFLGGVEGWGNSPEEMLAAIREFSRKAGYSRLVALGTSGGGPIALFAGSSDAFERAIAVCPPGYSRHPELADLYGKVRPTSGKLKVVAGSFERDVSAAAEVASVVDGVAVKTYDAYSTHNVLHRAEAAGHLSSLLKEWIS